MRFTLKDCQQLATSGNRIEFTQGTLARYVERYNKCAHPEEETEVLTIPRKLQIDPGIHFGKDIVKSIGNNYNAALPKSEGSGDGFQAGLIVHLSYFEKLTLRTGLVYHRFVCI